MAVKAIALDIDGTLTNDEKRITPRTREALLAAEHAGIRLVLASGRPAQGLRALADELELSRFDGLLVSYNGAHVERAQTGEVLFQRTLPQECVVPLLEHLRAFDVIPWVTEGRVLYVEDAYRCEIFHRGRAMNIVKYERDACGLLVHEVESLEALCVQHPQSKVLVAGTDIYLAQHWEQMAAPFQDKLSCMFTADFFFEFMATGVSKGAALAGALPALGIEAADVVAFGDAQNDVTMLTWAGVGVAMGNATSEARAAADMVTATNNEDGIAIALEQLLG